MKTRAASSGLVEIRGLQPLQLSTIWATDASSLGGGRALHLETQKNGRLGLRVLAQTGLLGFFEGGAGSNCLLQLSRDNVNDVLAALVNYVNTGELSPLLPVPSQPFEV